MSSEWIMLCLNRSPFFLFVLHLLLFASLICDVCIY
uniref:Endonuclease, putative n=1 Tax=Arundo donax TaxID=35708 RepID=A0A0A9CX39_ARUDO